MGQQLVNEPEVPSAGHRKRTRDPAMNEPWSDATTELLTPSGWLSFTRMAKSPPCGMSI